MIDDVVDGDFFRRGKPTAHQMFGLGSAVMGGQILFLISLKTGLNMSGPICGILIDTLIKMARGNAEEIFIRNFDEAAYFRVIHGKTGALFEAPCELGAISAGVAIKDIDNAKAYGYHIGMMYQMADDIVDVLKSMKFKEPIGDIRSGKPTAVFIHLFNNTKDQNIKDLLESFLDKEQLTDAQFAALFKEAEDCSLAYASDLIDKHRMSAEKLADMLPDTPHKKYLRSMPAFMCRALMLELDNLNFNK
jgi:geranylgeranyl pyrophosphate synthase